MPVSNCRGYNCISFKIRQSGIAQYALQECAKEELFLIEHFQRTSANGNVKLFL